MGDEQQSETALAALFVEDRYDLLLRGDIEGRRRLVGQHELGMSQEDRRDHDALQQSA